MSNPPLSRNWHIRVLLLLSAAFLLTSARGAEVVCPREVAPPVGFAHLTTATGIGGVAEINMFGYAGDGPDPRPMPLKTLADVRNDMQGDFVSMRNSERFGLPEFLYFALQDERVKNTDIDVLSVPRGLIWCAIHKGDMVLLSDRNTHHFTRIFDVDRVGGKVVFADRWPDRIFLLEGRNAANVRAKLYPPNIDAEYDKLMKYKFNGMGEKESAAINRNIANWANIVDRVKTKPVKVVEISRAEFDRVIVGAVTVNSLSRLENILKATTEPSVDAGKLINLSAIASQAGPQFSIDAGRYADRAVAAANSGTDRELRERAAGRSLNELMLARYQALELADQARAELVMKSIEDLLSTVPYKTAANSWRAQDAYRLGNAAGRAGLLDAAIRHYGHAIFLDPTHEEAYFYQAVAKWKIQDARGAVEDARIALKINKDRNAGLKVKHEMRHRNDREGLMQDDVEFDQVHARRLEELQLHVAALLALRECSESRGSAEELMHEKLSLGFAAIGQCEALAGKTDSGRRKLEEAISMETDADRRSEYDKLLRRLIPVK